MTADRATGAPPLNPMHLNAMHASRASLASQVRTLVRRNLTHIKRMPEMLMDVTIQPVMFVALFAYVFGGSIQTGTAGGYREWLLPGIMAQTMAFASFIVAIGLTNDLDKGIIDRLRALPISRSAVVIARSISSLIHSSIGVIVMSLTGLLVGWRIHTDVPRAALAYGLLLLWGFAMIWVGMFVGSAMRSVEAVQGVMFTTTFPITFLANTFAPTEGDAQSAAHAGRMEPDLGLGPGHARTLGQCRTGDSRRRAAPAPPHPRQPALVRRDLPRPGAAGGAGVPQSHREGLTRTGETPTA
jgi:ABC-type transport system involved in cytochrome c biogenesis permease component